MPPTPRIAFDAKRLYHNHTGLGNYSRTLVQQLAQQHPHDYQIHLYTPKHAPAPDAWDDSAMHVHTAQGRPGAWWRTFGVVADLQRHGIDLYHGLSHELPYGIHRTRIKTVLTVHDLIFRLHPEQYQPLDRWLYHHKLRYACQAADAIVAISAHTKRDLVQHYRVPPSKVHVIYQTCDTAFAEGEGAPLPSHAPARFMLYVGSIIERKNLLTLVQALQQLPPDTPPLIVVGKGRRYAQRVQAYVATHGLAERILFWHDVDNALLRTLYRRAELFIYPSMYEGFGIPVIEALYSRTPVLTTSQSALPEAGGPYSYYTDGTDPAEMASQIAHILAHPAEVAQRVIQGYEYAQTTFAARPLTTALHELYQQLLAAPMHP